MLPFLNRHVRGLVEFQRLTGCRPGEACQARRSDIDTSGPVWFFRPEQHKKAHRGKPRVIPLGPKAQALLTAFFPDDDADYCFSPRRAVAEFRAAQRARRKTPVQPSQQNRAKPNPAKQPADRYDTASYDHAIAAACEKAFPPPGPLAQRADETRAEWWARLTADERAVVKAWRAAHRWHPNQLRHSFATRVRKERGLEAAQVVLGHATADITQVYAERDLTLAAEVAAKMG